MLPDTLSPVNFTASPDGTALAIVASLRRAAAVYRAGVGGARLGVGTIPLSGGAFQVVGTFDSGEPEIGFGWEDNRTITIWLMTVPRVTR